MAAVLRVRIPGSALSLMTETITPEEAIRLYVEDHDSSKEVEEFLYRVLERYREGSISDGNEFTLKAMCFNVVEWNHDVQVQL